MSIDDRLVAWARAQVDHDLLPTSVIGVADARGIRFIEAFGSESGRRVRDDDTFALYSVTKPISALGVRHAVESSGLDWATPLAEVADGPAIDGVELHHLLSHTSGIADIDLDRDPEGALRTARREFAPGSKVSYNNLVWFGAAELVHQATGEPLREHVGAVLESAGAGGISFEAYADALPVHRTRELGLDAAAMGRLEHPAAGLAGRAEDLLNLGIAQLTATDAAAAARDAMLQPRTLGLPRVDPNASVKEWGLGFSLRRTVAAPSPHGPDDDPARPAPWQWTTYGHDGWSGTQWWMFPQQQLCVVFLTNVLDAAGVGVNFDALRAIPTA